jgi:hypothetical protein
MTPIMVEKRVEAATEQGEVGEVVGYGIEEG